MDLFLGSLLKYTAQAQFHFHCLDFPLLKNGTFLLVASPHCSPGYWEANIAPIFVPPPQKKKNSTDKSSRHGGCGGGHPRRGTGEMKVSMCLGVVLICLACVSTRPSWVLEILSSPPIAQCDKKGRHRRGSAPMFIKTRFKREAASVVYLHVPGPGFDLDPRGGGRLFFSSCFFLVPSVAHTARLATRARHRKRRVLSEPSTARRSSNRHGGQTA